MIRAFSFLQRHPQSGILYFRKRIPRRHRFAFGGRHEVKRSLGTCDKNIALPKAMMLYVELQAKFNEFEEESNMGDGPYIGKITVGDLDVKSGTVKGLDVDFGGDSEKELAAALAIVQEIRGGGEGQPPIARNAPQDGNVKSEKLSIVCEKYRKEKSLEGSWSKKTEEEQEATHGFLIQVCGNVEASTVRTVEARKMKEILLKLPPNRTKGKYAGKTIKQIIAMDPGETISVRTINNNYIQRFSSLFSWAVRNGYCAVNPFAGLKMKIKSKASEDKDLFSEADLVKIFNIECFNKDEFAKKPWKYWVPLIGLFTGARVQEIAQLRIGDVFEEEGVHAFHITKKAGSLKNMSSERVVPVHPKLLELGFWEYLVGMKQAGRERLFPELYTPALINSGGKVSRQVGRWFNEKHLKSCGLRPTTRKISFHSFRHTFIDFFKKHDVPEVKVKQLTGHKHEGLTYGRYGGNYNARELYDLISLIDFGIPQP